MFHYQLTKISIDILDIESHFSNILFQMSKDNSILYSFIILQANQYILCKLDIPSFFEAYYSTLNTLLYANKVKNANSSYLNSTLYIGS
jgi:hypothetical protein